MYSFFNSSKLLILKRLLPILFVFLLSGTAFSQNPSTTKQEIDSLISVTITLGRDSQKLANATNEIVSRSQAIDYSRGIVFGHLNNALSLFYSNLHKQSILALQKTQQEKEYLETNPLLRARIHNVYGLNYHAIQLFSLASQHYLQAVNFATQENLEIVGREAQINQSYFRLASLYYYRSNIDSTLYYTEKLKNETVIQTERKSAYLNQLSGYLHLHSGKLDSALNDYKQAYNFLRNTEDPARNLTLLGLGRVAHRKKNYAEAADYYNQALEDARISIIKMHILKSFADLYKSSGNTQMERVYLRRYTELQDSLLAANTPKRMFLLDRKLNNFEAQNGLETQRPNSTATFTSLFLIMLTGIFTVFLYRRNRAQRRKLSKTTHRIQSLEKKVNLAFEEVAALAKGNDPSFMGRFREVYPLSLRHI